MNIAKNMEVIFIAAVALIGGASAATAGSADRGARVPVQVALSAPAPASAQMQVVTVSAKRLSAAEKAQLPQ